MADTQRYQEFSSDFTGSVASLQQDTCADFVADQIPVDVPCPSCIPDPTAIVPDWTTLTKTQPFLNQQTCQYSVTIDTKYTDVGGTDLVNRINEYAPVAARELLRYYNKLETDLIVDTLVNGYAGTGPIIQGTDWFVPFQQEAKLKILYTISAFNFDGISSDNDDPSAFNKETAPSANEVDLDLDKLAIKLERTRQIFSVYSKYQAAMRNIDNGSFIFENTNKEFVLGSLNDETSILHEFSMLENTINNILDENNFVFFGTFSPQFRVLSNTRRKATSIKFGYAEKYVLDKITIVEKGCPDVVIENEKLSRYSDESPLNNPTIIAYLARIDELYEEIMAMEAPMWTDILVKYTYPTLTINYGENTLFDNQEALAECVASAIADYGSTIANRALDSLFSLPDIIAKKLNNYSCLTDDEIRNLESAGLTLSEIIKKEGGSIWSDIEKAIRNSDIYKPATIITDFVRRFRNIGKFSLVKLFDSILDDYGFCGMLALIQGLFNCIATGFSFEELLRKIVESALKGFTPLQISKFLVLLPPDKQQEVIAKVDEVLKENDLINGFMDSYNKTSKTLEQNKQKFIDDKNAEDELIEKSKTAIQEQKDNIATIEETSYIAPIMQETQIENAQSIISLERDKINNARDQLGTNSLGDSLGKVQSIIMKAYIDAFLELVDINQLYAILTRFPGVKILAQLINATNCPTPDDASKTTWLNFLNTLEIEWCKLHFDLALPPLPSLPDIGAFFSNLWKALGKAIKDLVLQLITKIVQEVISKLLQILLNSLCDLLGTLTQATAAALTGRNAATIMLDMLRKSFGCPPLDNGEQEQALLEAVGQVFGGQAGQGASAFTTDEVSSFLGTTSVSLTAFELVDLLKGNLSVEKAKYLKSIYRATEPKFASIFPNESSIASLFSTLGNLIPDNILNDYEEKAAFLIDSEFPANSSVCGTPDSIDKFKQLRENLLRGKGLSDDEIKHQIDGMQDRMNQDLGFITDLAAKGFGPTVGEKLAVSLYGPDVLENPMAVLKAQDPNCPSSVYISPYNSPAVKNVQDAANSSLFGGLKNSYLFDMFRQPTVFDTIGTGKKPVAFLNAILSDKNARDFVKHNLRTNDLLFPLYNSQEQKDSMPFGSPFTSKNIENNFFPDTVSKQTQIGLISASISASSDIIFANNIEVYSTSGSNPKRSILGKQPDYTLTIDAFFDGKLNKSYNLLYSQFVLNNGIPSSENINRIAVTTQLTGNVLNITDKPDTEVEGSTGPTGSLSISGKDLETFNTVYQSRYDLDEGINNIKEQYLPIVVTNSPQADSFVEYMQQKIQNVIVSGATADITLFNTISDKAMKFIVSEFTDDEAYKYGYDYNSEKITQDDIDLDPDTLERKTNNPRVVFLDYQKYGGTEEQPPVYIKPPTRVGWLGVADTIIPEFGCDPKVENIIDFDSLQSLMSDLQKSLSDDPKLMYSPDCREQVPYLKPLSAVMAANLQVAITTTMRVYISEAILKCMPLYNKFVVSYDKIVDELYFDYLIKNLEDGLKNQGDGILEIKNDKYYLYFLEQCVQVVSRKVIDGEITLTDLEQQALNSINDMINNFYFIKEKDYAFILNASLALGEIKKLISNFYYTLKNNNLEKLTFTDIESIVIGAETVYAALETVSIGYPTLAEPTRQLKSSFSTFKSVIEGTAKRDITLDLAKRNLLKQIKAVMDAINSIFVQSVPSNISSMLITVLNKYNSEFHLVPPSLKYLRKEMVLEGIRTTAVQAKILMRKIMKEEIATMSSNFAAHIYTTPSITNIRKHFLDTDTYLIAPSGSSRYFEIFDPINSEASQKDKFVLERYVTVENRIIPISGTTIPSDIVNRPSEIYGNINVTTFKDWIAELSPQTQDTDIYKLFGDLSVTGSNTTGFELTGSSIGIKYGIRLSYITEVINSGVKTYVPIPVANAEIDMINDKLGNFNPDSGINKYNHDCLVKALYETDDFRFLFYYCFPLQKYMSAISVFITETFVKLIGVNDGWVSTPKVDFDKDKRLKFFKTKEACQIFFETFYNWDDTEYTNKKLKNSLSGTDSLIEAANSLLRMPSPLIYTDWRIVPRKPFNQDGIDCDAAEET